MCSPLKLWAQNINYVPFRSYCIRLQSRFMEKILKKQSRKNQKSTKLTAEIIPDDGKKCSRRLKVLNKLCMIHISDVLQTGVSSSKLLGLGIEISKINLTSDLNTAKVYWIAKKDELDNDKILEVLEKSSFELRREIAEMRVMGKVPNIKFVRDLSYESSLKLDKLFEKIDLGKDYKPTHPSRTLENEPLDDYERTIPKMTQKTLGLDYDLIKSHILESMERSREVKLPKKKFELEGDENYEDPGKLVAFDKKIFAKFYNRRRIHEAKMRKYFQKCENFPENEDGDDTDDDISKDDQNHDVDQFFDDISKFTEDHDQKMYDFDHDDNYSNYYENIFEDENKK